VQAVCTAGDEPQASSRKSLWASGSRRLSTDPERGYVRARAALFDSVRNAHANGSAYSRACGGLQLTVMFNHMGSKRGAGEAVILFAGNIVHMVLIGSQDVPIADVKSGMSWALSGRRRRFACQNTYLRDSEKRNPDCGPLSSWDSQCPNFAQRMQDSNCKHYGLMLVRCWHGSHLTCFTIAHLQHEDTVGYAKRCTLPVLHETIPDHSTEKIPACTGAPSKQICVNACASEYHWSGCRQTWDQLEKA
jgi:hypothetical protein